VIGIVDARQFEFGRVRNADPDADQSLGQQHAVGGSAGADGRDVGVRRVGTVIQPEDRIGSLGRVEPCLNVTGRDRPAVTRLVTGVAAAPVRAELLEERVASVYRTCCIECRGQAGRIGKDHERTWLLILVLIFGADLL